MKKSYPLLQFKAASDGDDEGIFEAIVSVFGNVDFAGDRMMPGAFKRTLAERGLPPIYYNHMWVSEPIGEALDAAERDEGLWVRAKLWLDFDGPARVFRSMKAASEGRGGIKEFSFAYDVQESRMVTEDGEEIREITDVDLFEVGPVTVGMNDQTQLLEVASRAGLVPVPGVGLLLAEGKHQAAPKLVQQAHDLLVKAGCKCGDDGDDDDGKGSGGPAGDTAGRIDPTRVMSLLAKTRWEEG